jgi:hypothetical protein
MKGTSQFLELELRDAAQKVAGVMMAEVTEPPWLDLRHEGALKEYILAIGHDRAPGENIPAEKQIRPGEMRRIPPVSTSNLVPAVIHSLPGITVWQVRYFR